MDNLDVPLSPQYAEALFSETAPGRDVSSDRPGREAECDEQEDIYRGQPPSPPRSPPPHPASVSSASSSSSGWSGLGLRRGALGAVLELAINRWARSSSGSSISSSSASVNTRLPRRRRRRASNATAQNAHSESLIRARRKAREEFRALPREFVLFLSAALTPQAPHTQTMKGTTPLSQNQQSRVLRTSSLPLVLAQLDSAIKRSAKARKPKQSRAPSPGRTLGTGFHDYMQPEVSSTVSPDNGARLVKGKAREDRAHRSQVHMGTEQSPKQQAWWLDVSSPTWNDMREIGKVLHLHPLTLEDILHQDPREKLELFPRLGYYFIVFRALESERTRSKDFTQLKSTVKDGGPASCMDKSVVGATNVYIVVFREGICTFHFEDIADHTERVRNKVMQLEETVHMSSDWIAHGILDSIVDDFFPLLNSIEQEVKELDDLVLSINGQTNTKSLSQGSDSPLKLKAEVQEKEPEFFPIEAKEKTQSDASGSEQLILGGTLRRPRRIFLFVTLLDLILGALPIANISRRARNSQQSQHHPPSQTPLMRMASTRRLVTSLSRLLGTKSEVVSQIRKRVSGNVVVGLSMGPFGHTSSAEVAIYLGDIQDHILTLQQSLAHYERMLSHSHPAYLLHLRVSLSQAKGGMDKALFMLSVISVSVVAMQLLTGMFSVNLGSIPRNQRDGDPPGLFDVFGAIVAGVVLVGASMIFLARYWWLHAKRKYARRSKF